MPRANRHFVPGQFWHITHRCHKKSFLLKFARDRRAYLGWLRGTCPTQLFPPACTFAGTVSMIGGLGLIVKPIILLDLRKPKASMYKNLKSSLTKSREKAAVSRHVFVAQEGNANGRRQ